MKLPPFKLERYFARYEFSAPYLLCTSDCESVAVEDLLALEDGAETALRKLWLGYTESPGSPELRREIAAIYETIEPEQVLVHSGAEEAIFNFMHAVLDKSDHLIVHFPAYQSLFQVAESLGCEVSRWEADPENGWKLDLDWLEKNIRPNTRAIVINCPHNPTGYLMKRADFEKLAQLAQERNILLFSDEVYRELEYDPAFRLPAACDLNENCISLGVMSKAYGLAGLRIGWIATRNSDIYRRIAAFKDYTTICNSAPSEFLSSLALRHRVSLLERNLGIIKDNLVLLDHFFEKYPQHFRWHRPVAGPIAFPALQERQDIEKFCAALVESKGVLLLPSTTYDYGNSHFRLGFGRKNMPECLEKLEEFIIEQEKKK
jgi:aspartate/methionine/tyrosine aminotransferase